MTNDKVSFCDKCRDKMISDSEVHLIILDVPSSGFASILGQNKTKFRLCKKCFIIHREYIEKWVMKK